MQSIQFGSLSARTPMLTDTDKGNSEIDYATTRAQPAAHVCRAFAHQHSYLLARLHAGPYKPQHKAWRPRRTARNFYRVGISRAPSAARAQSAQIERGGGRDGNDAFFTLPGFLITRPLLKDPKVSAFLIKWFFIILPLAWRGMAAVLIEKDSSGSVYLSHLLFTPICPAFILAKFSSDREPSQQWMDELPRTVQSSAACGNQATWGEQNSSTILPSRFMVYIATISSAFYVIHSLLMDTRMGTGEKFRKYAKRPPLLATTFVLAHLSAFHEESRFVALGNK